VKIEWSYIRLIHFTSLENIIDRIPGHDLSNLFDPFFPLLSLPQQICVHQVNHFGDNLLVISSQLIVLSGFEKMK